MDKRLIAELVPGPAFLLGHALGGVFMGAGFAVAATGLAVLLRWHWDRSLPLLALSILGLTLVMLTIGLVLDDTIFVKVSNTLGSLVFAAFIGLGARLRPSLLRRSLGYTLSLTDHGWHLLHLVWIGLSLGRALANEIVWRGFSEPVWAMYNGLSDIAWVALFALFTWILAHRHWDGAKDP